MKFSSNIFSIQSKLHAFILRHAAKWYYYYLHAEAKKGTPMNCKTQSKLAQRECNRLFWKWQKYCPISGYSTGYLILALEFRKWLVTNELGSVGVGWVGKSNPWFVWVAWLSWFRWVTTYMIRYYHLDHSFPEYDCMMKIRTYFIKQCAGVTHQNWVISYAYSTLLQ